MEGQLKQKFKNRNSRALRIRKRVRGTASKPRMSVFKSNCHLSVQLIDDEAGVTLASVSSLQKDIKSSVTGGKSEVAKFIGSKIASDAISIGITSVVFDRGFRMYHGHIKILAESAREAGLKF